MQCMSFRRERRQGNAPTGPAQIDSWAQDGHYRRAAAHPRINVAVVLSVLVGRFPNALLAASSAAHDILKSERSKRIVHVICLCFPQCSPHPGDISRALEMYHPALITLIHDFVYTQHHNDKVYLSIMSNLESHRRCQAIAQRSHGSRV